MDVQCTSQEGTVLSQEVRDLVEYAWNEAAGRLCDVLSAPVNSVKLDEVVKAEGTLLSLKEALELGDKGASQVKALSDEFYSAVPHRNTGTLIDSKSLIAQKQDLCQVHRFLCVYVIDPPLLDENVPFDQTILLIFYTTAYQRCCEYRGSNELEHSRECLGEVQKPEVSRAALESGRGRV